MNWETLLLLACPLMMLFCMKGMFSGKKDEKTANQNVVQQGNQGKQNEIEALQIKMAKIMEQNEELMKEVKAMKKERAKKEVFTEAPVVEPQPEEGVNDAEVVKSEEQATEKAVTNDVRKKGPDLKVVEKNKKENAS